MKLTHRRARDHAFSSRDHSFQTFIGCLKGSKVRKQVERGRYAQGAESTRFKIRRVQLPGSKPAAKTLSP